MSDRAQSFSLKRIGPDSTAAIVAAGRIASIALVVAIAYYLGAQFGFSFRYPGSPLSVIWPPNALLLAALLLIPIRLWWVVLFAVLPAHVLVEYQNGVQGWTILGLYVTNCGQAVLGAAGIRWLFGGDARLDSLRRVVVYGACAVIAAPFILSFVDTFVAVFTQWETHSNVQLHFEERFISNVLATLTLPPVILAIAAHRRFWPRKISPGRYLEATILELCIVGTGVLIFGTPIIALTGQSGLLYLPLPFLLWAAVRFGVGGTSVALLSITLLSALWDVERLRGPFVAGSSAASVLTVQIFLIALAAPALLLAALMEERNRSVAELHKEEERYRGLVETQPDLICRYLPDGTLTYVNKTYCHLFGKTREELLGANFMDLLPLESARRACDALERFLRNPSIMHDEHPAILPNGGVGWQHWVEYPIYGADGALVEIQAIGSDVTERKRAEQEVAWLAAHLLRAQDDERRRIARDLHDGTAQTLAAVELILGRMRNEIAHERQDMIKLDRLLSEGHSLASEALQEIRSLSYLLHPPELEHLGLAGAIQAYAEGFSRRSGIAVTVEAPDDLGRLPQAIEIALFRVLQECLTNVLRHSQSSCASVRLFAGMGCVALRVRDRGRGIDPGIVQTEHNNPEALGVGIASMRQRMLNFGGRLKVSSGFHGTKVTAIVPVCAIPDDPYSFLMEDGTP
jgi:PAS domain S-box-containing protein